MNDFFNEGNAISGILTRWYEKNKRDLPWRNQSDPYKVWISEIILQQTRVNQGMSYYLRFVERFPTVAHLAEANEDEVLKYWQGLGYYSRARNLHKAAQHVMADFGGVFPMAYDDVRKLAGVGDYTAAAICSFAGNRPYAVVDGNVYRFLSRLFGVDLAIDTATGKKYFAELAKNLLPEKNPGLHNQAIMEFGALQCVPSSPVCTSCPFIEMCSAFRNNTIPKLPVKKQKTTVKNRFFNYLYIENGKNTFLQKRTAKDVWQNLYEFPLVETDKLLTIGELVAHPAYNEIFGNQPNSNLIKTSNPLKHVLSHRVIHAQFFTINIQSPGIETPTGAIEVPLDEIDRYAVSRLMELFLESRTTI